MEMIKYENHLKMIISPRIIWFTAESRGIIEAWTKVGNQL